MKIENIKIEFKEIKTNFEVNARTDDEVQITEGQSRHEHGPWKLWGELSAKNAQVVSRSEAQVYADAFIQEHGFQKYDSIIDKGNGVFEIQWSGENPFKLNGHALADLGYPAAEWERSNKELERRYWKLEVQSTTMKKLTIDEVTWWLDDGLHTFRRITPVTGRLLESLFSDFYYSIWKSRWTPLAADDILTFEMHTRKFTLENRSTHTIHASIGIDEGVLISRIAIAGKEITARQSHELKDQTFCIDDAWLRHHLLID